MQYALRHPVLFVGHGIIAVVIAVSFFGLGRVTKPTPIPPPIFPSYAMVNQAGTVLAHDFDVQYISLSSAPDFISCDHVVDLTGAQRAAIAPHKALVRCIFQVNYTDETSAYWSVYLDRHAQPIFAKKSKALPVN